MSAPAGCAAGPVGACLACARRSWLLGELSGPLDYQVRDRARFFELLALADEELVAALGGRRGDELRERYGRLDTGELAADAGGERLCRHRPGYPATLASPWAPPMLEVAGGAERLGRLTGAPAVALVGARRASDYGMAVAGSLARGLAASGVTVVAALGDGIARAAHAGALEVGAGSVAVLGGGLGVGCGARLRALHGRVAEGGCVVSELPARCAGRCWGAVAGERIVGELAAVTVVVEAQDTPAGLTGARVAEALGRVVAAVPGRVSSPLAAGPHALLVEGARLVRGAEDVLELLGLDPPAWGRAEGGPTSAPPAMGPAGPLRASLRATLERVGAGCDTPDRLTRAGEDPCEVLLALSELEVMGLVARGDGGRYLPRAL